MTTAYNDFFGYPLAIGDTVAFNYPGYKCMRKDTIVAFTPKQVRLEYATFQDRGDGNRYEFSGVEMDVLNADMILDKR